MLRKMVDYLEIDSNDSYVSAGIKGMTDGFIKGCLVVGAATVLNGVLNRFKR